MNYNGKEYEKEYIYIYVYINIYLNHFTLHKKLTAAEALCCILETNKAL